MGKSWKELFTFSRREQGGITVLLILLLCLILLYPLIPKLIKQKKYDSSDFIQQARQFMIEMRKKDSLESMAKISRVPQANEQDKLAVFLAHPFTFDPNTAPEAVLVATGLNRFTADNICKYCKKGGHFKKPADLEKIYGMDHQWLEAVSPFIKIVRQAEEETGKKIPEVDATKGHGVSILDRDVVAESLPKPLLIDLNSADTAEIMRCKGIGQTFAGRIISYRHLLGGFYSKEQVLEVYGMDSSRFNSFREEIVVYPDAVRKMDLNHVEFKEMLRHPYFEYYLVKAIFDYKKSKREIDSVSELRSLPEMYPGLYNKVSPYLEVGKKKPEAER